jgi:hypothetical protein
MENAKREILSRTEKLDLDPHFVIKYSTLDAYLPVNMYLRGCVWIKPFNEDFEDTVKELLVSLKHYQYKGKVFKKETIIVVNLLGGIDRMSVKRSSFLSFQIHLHQKKIKSCIEFNDPAIRAEMEKIGLDFIKTVINLGEDIFKIESHKF